MRNMLITVTGLMIAVSAAAARADITPNDISAARALFASSGCVNCHQINEKASGPALKQIAKRYQGKNVRDELAARIREGSMGRWGDDEIHPPQGVLEPQEAKLLATWVLNGAP